MRCTETAERCLEHLAQLPKPSGELAALFRKSEWAFLTGRREECLAILDQLKCVLLEKEDGGSGLAAVSMETAARPLPPSSFSSNTHFN